MRNSTQLPSHMGYERYGPLYDRALALCEQRSVKHILFEPSGREIWVVVGSEGDQIVFADVSFCSCHQFYFRKLVTKREPCHHLLSVWLAKERGRQDTIRHSDDEYQEVLLRMIRDTQGLILQEGVKRLSKAKGKPVPTQKGM